MCVLSLTPFSFRKTIFKKILGSKTSYRLFSLKFRVTKKKRRMVRHKTAFVFLFGHPLRNSLLVV